MVLDMVRAGANLEQGAIPMKLSKYALAAVVAGGAVMFGAATPASAGVSISIGLGGGGYYSGDYYYDRPCSFYYHNNIPAPLRCRDYLERYWGPGIYVDGD